MTPRTFADYLDHHAGTIGDRPALVRDDVSLTYADLLYAVRYTALGLAADGVIRENIVGVTVADEIEHFIVTMSLFRLGCAHVVLPTHETATVRARLARRIGVDVVVADPAEALEGVAAVAARFGREERRDVGRTQASGGIAMYAASSGSTGGIKVIPISHGMLAAQSDRWSRSPTTLLRPAHMEFNNSRKQRLYALKAGGTNAFIGADMDPMAACRRHRATALGLTVAQTKSIVSRAHDGSGGLPHECVVRIGGSFVEPGLRQAVLARLSPRLNVNYSTQEAGPVACWRSEDHGGLGETVGRVNPGLRLEIVGDGDTRSAPGERGSIRLRGPGVATRYLDDSEGSERTFRDGWFYPGDVGKLRPDGLLTVEGRADDMMSFASINVFPSEIEKVVADHPQVIECAAFAVRSETVGDVPLVALVTAHGTEVDAILAHARGLLGVRAPRRAISVDRIPVTATGKVDRRALVSLFLSGREGGFDP